MLSWKKGGDCHARKKALRRIPAADDRRGALTDLSSGLCAFLPSERRQALNSILGIGALRGSAFPEGALPYRVTAARIDVCGPEPSIVLEYRGPDDKGISFSPYFSVWYAGESGMENVPGRLWETGPGTYYTDAGCFITQTFSLADFDLSRTGLYRLCFYGEISGKIINDPPESDCYIEFEVSGSAEPAPELCDDERTLRLKYPYYFDLDTEHGLDVLIWQMAPGDYSCMIFPGSGTELSYREMIDLTNEEDKWPVDTETAKIILVSYGLPRGRVRLLPFEHYHSSYLYRIDDAYMEELGRMFFGDG
ncbi:MAG: hypothetical protein J5586_00380 [Clostridia bacterium]|nr:hypothetical protein [Clostridia bacterium]